MSRRYSGFTNYGTWNICLWIDNDHWLYQHWQELTEQTLSEVHGTAEEKRKTAAYALEDLLKDEFTMDAADRLPTTGPFADLLGWALEQVDWREVAMHLLEGAEVEDDPEEDYGELGGEG